ncbi:hypothetical protein [Intrasporangium sp. DVR]|uniref:hypothetical protein n=1 Tax=Intrasporangium sp. DVR TaxID=3127867 RepID=UPI00313A5457
MSDQEEARGRLILVTSASTATAGEVAAALGQTLPRCAVVGGGVVDAMVVTGRAAEPLSDEAGDALRAATDPAVAGQLLLRWSACLALAETFQLEGFDVVVHDVVLGDHLEDFLDLAAPEPVHVIVIGDPIGSTTPRWGLWLDPAPAPDVTAAAVLARLDEAVVLTAEPADPHDGGRPA